MCLSCYPVFRMPFFFLRATPCCDCLNKSLMGISQSTGSVLDITYVIRAVLVFLLLWLLLPLSLAVETTLGGLVQSLPPGLACR